MDSRDYILKEKENIHEILVVTIMKQNASDAHFFYYIFLIVKGAAFLMGLNRIYLLERNSSESRKGVLGSILISFTMMYTDFL